MILALAIATAQPMVAPPAAPLPSPAPTTASDPARIAAAQRLLDATHIEQQYDQMFARMVPMMSVQVLGTLKDNVKVPPKVRAYLSDSASEATAIRIFTDEALQGFKGRYPQMRAATAREYARIFTADELTGLAAFYATPLGQKALSSLPELQNKLMPIGMAAGAEVGREAMVKMIARLGLDDERTPRS